jgi:hypothetical protein
VPATRRPLGIRGVRRTFVSALVSVTAGLCGVLQPSASAASPPATFAAFTKEGPGYSLAFAKAVRTSQTGMVQFRFPGTLHIDSVRPPLYALVSVFVLYVSDRSLRPSSAEQAGDISRDCLGRFFVSHPVPSGTTGFAYECRPNLSEWMCTSDVERRNVRVAISVTTPKKDQCLPYEATLQRVFFRKAGLAVG